MTADLVVVGAGAAGLWAAARAAELGRDVVLLEKTPRTGTKVLASGGTRCNLTTTLGPDAAGALFGSRGERFLRRGLRALPSDAVRTRFHDLGVPTVEAPLDKVFPASNRARDVRDALESWTRGAGAEIRLGAGVRSVEAEASRWLVRLESGEALQCKELLLCPGGKSYPRTGTTGDGYAWLADLDLPLVEPVPALAPLTSPAPWVRALAGVALQEVAVRLVDSAGGLLGRRERPIVFTHQGISGPAAMDLSEGVARGSGGHILELDLMPGVDRQQLREALVQAAGMSGAPLLATALARLMEASPPRRVVLAAFEQAGLETSNPAANTLSRSQRHALIEALKCLRVPVDGTLGWDRAEVTAGGLDLRVVDPGSMRVQGREGLLVCGELLDLAGPIGGLNFQAAFASAELAARALAR